MSLPRLLSRPFFAASLLWLVLLSVTYVLADYWIMPTIAGQFKATAPVPELIGLRTDSARIALEKAGIEFMLDSTGDYSQNIPAGHILSQFPDAGTVVKQGRRVWVKVSKGFKSVEIPPLRGLSMRQAEITLQQAGLTVGREVQVTNSGIPAGAVIGTRPAAGTQVETGHTVDVQVAAGYTSHPTTMPTLRGLSLPQAKQKLEELQLKPGKLSYRKESRSLPNTVLDQGVPAGTPLQGQKVDLLLSK